MSSAGACNSSQIASASRQCARACSARRAPAPVPDGLAVHALEHGHVVIRYAGGVPTSEVAALARIARRYGADVVLAPHPALERGIALTAWGRIDLLDRYEQDRVVAFVEALRGRYDHGWTSEQDC
jgi:hypothetical protein